MNARMEKLKKRLFDVEFYTKKQWWGEGLTILDDENVRKEPLIVRKALACKYVLDNMPSELKKDELITGIARMSMIGFGHTYVEYALPEEIEAAAKINLSTLSVWGHQPPNYEKVLKEGLGGLRRRIWAQINDPEKQVDQEKQDLYRAMLITLDAIRDLALRYRDMNLQAAWQESDPVRRKELLEIAHRCERVPEYPAESFAEALQSSWFIYMCLQSNMENIPLGRADQYLYPYYEADKRNGVIDEEYARELVTSWLVKFNERVQMNPEHWENHMTPSTYSIGCDPDDQSMFINLENEEDYNFGVSANHWDLNVIFSGTTRDGKDATNDLTYIFLECWSYLEVVMPVVAVRFSENAPQKLYETCADILRVGTGEPVIYNDKMIIDGYVKLGVPIDDARDYSNDGCWETLIPGKSHYSYAHIEPLQMLEYVLTRGYSLVRKQQEGLDQGDPCELKTWDEFYAAFRTQLLDQWEKVTLNRIHFYGASYKIAPDPMISAMIDGCIEKGIDLTAGGAQYTIFSPLLSGFADCIDSLAAIKKLVYEEKKVSMDRLVKAIKSDFADEEPLRLMLMNRAPKYGNDDDYVDSISHQVINDVVAKTGEMAKNYPWLIMPVGIGTFENYSKFGHKVGASASGRHAQEPVGSNYSPAFGADKVGPTAAIRSALSADLWRFVTGCPLDMQVNSNETSGEKGLQRLMALMKSFIDMGGIMLTITGVNNEMLRDAQVHPEQYRSLRVRMGGLSAYFIQLPREMQEVLIKKTTYSL